MDQPVNRAAPADAAAPTGAPPPRKRLSVGLPEFLAARHAVPEVFDAIVVGSGYGGSVAAHALAGATDNKTGRPLNVLLLERGKEFLPADFPATFGELPRELRFANPAHGTVVGHEGLFDVRAGHDVLALVANGLGGGSLINAGVMLEPDPSELRDPHFAAEVQALQNGAYFERARRWLGAEVWRNGTWVPNTIVRTQPQDRPLKTVALDRLAAAGLACFEHPPITVALERSLNSAGTELQACVRCGDCMTGCRQGAKDSLDTNLLSAAVQRGGIRIVTGASVTAVLLEDGPGEAAWGVRVVHTDPRLQERELNVFKLLARRVILAAGTLGSPEILLRSRSDELVFSPRLGHGFSCNGDNIGAFFRLRDRVNGRADEDDHPSGRGVGPTITGSARFAPNLYRDGHMPGGHPERGFRLQEFSVPGPLARLFDETVTSAHMFGELPEADWSRHRSADADPLAVNPASMARTLLVGTIGHDDAAGALSLADPVRPRGRFDLGGDAPAVGTLRIHWPDANRGAELEASHTRLQKLERAARAAGQPQARFVPNPVWRMLPPALESLISQPRGPVLTVHPLGGCGIGAYGDTGVVDRHGVVFDALPRQAQPQPPGANKRRAAPSWQGSLLVLDGSIVPGSLGANPALTITALALRAMAVACASWGVTCTTGAPPQAGVLPPVPVKPPPPRPAPQKTRVAVTERLYGPLALRQLGDMVAELTLHFAPRPVAELIGPERTTVCLDTEDASRVSTLRLYRLADWNQHALRAASDATRRTFVVVEAGLEGHIRYLHREASRPLQRTLRGLWAWLLNRGTREVWQRIERWQRQRRVLQPQRTSSEGGVFKMIWDFVESATRAGEARRFDYCLKVTDMRPVPAAAVAGLAGFAWKKGTPIHGEKRLTYNRRANPWNQLTELTLTQMPGLVLPPTSRALPVLKLDARFIAGQGSPLLRITEQRHHAEGLAELLSFGLYLMRVLISTHLWTFRKPDEWRDAQKYREPHRLPEALGDLEPQIAEIVTDHWPDDHPLARQPLRIRLTRYARASPPGTPPLVLIHGYSVSGNTFTHPSLKPSAAEYFWRQGRDVWVVELRTSTALASCEYPWAMEQPALIDIPAALLHVQQVTGQRVDVLAHCIGCVMLSMALLADPRRIRSGDTELGVDAWLTSEHFGMLAAFNGAAPTGGEHPTVRRVVLSQKGPLLRYTDANILRAFVLQYARRLLLGQRYSFKPSADPGAAEQLVDRFLSSLPYPPADYDRENPLWPCARTPWVATRHRMDALFGRDFDAANMSDETLESIDDLFGPIALDTVAQTIHFARFDTITNQRGRGEFVTRRTLARRWRGIPTLSLHGADNGLADPHTQRLLVEQFALAKVPHRSIVLPGLGHQDVFIGRDSTPVFAQIDAFLRDAPPAPRTPQMQAPFVAVAPWIGPRLAPPTAHHRKPRIGAISRPDQGRATLWLLPVLRYAPGAAGLPYLLLPPTDPHWAEGATGGSGDWLFATPPLGRGAWPPDDPAEPPPEPGWLVLFVYPVAETTAVNQPLFVIHPAVGIGGAAAAVAGPGGAAPGPMVGNAGGAAAAAARSATVVRDNHFTGHLSRPLNPALLASIRPLAAPIGGLPPAAALATPLQAARPWRPKPRAVLSRLDIYDAALLWLEAGAGRRATIDGCFVARRDVQRVADLHPLHPQAPVAAPGLRFALGSCQYPHGLFDKGPAGHALAILETQLDEVALLLLVGDQIYADASAGLVDPTRRDELYQVPHERALRLPSLRAVMQRVPVQMLLDDHEIDDNWQPLPPRKPPAAGKPPFENRGPGPVRDLRRDRDRDLSELRRDGMAAYQRYQRMQPRRAPSSPGPADFDFVCGGHPFYMLDTRSQRRRGRPSDGPDASAWGIVSVAQLGALQRWLLRHRDAVKFVATPSLLLPRRAATTRGGANAALSDAWDGFPKTLAVLLQFIAAKGIRHTVFLSGDEHHSMLTEVWLGGGPQPVKLVSVHSSGLYAPFPFANGRPAELEADETFSLGPSAVSGPVRVQVQTKPASLGDGFAVLEVVQGCLLLRFDKADGTLGPQHVVPL